MMDTEKEQRLQAEFDRLTLELNSPEGQAREARFNAELAKEARKHQLILARSWAFAHTRVIC